MYTYPQNKENFQVKEGYFNNLLKARQNFLANHKKRKNIIVDISSYVHECLKLFEESNSNFISFEKSWTFQKGRIKTNLEIETRNKTIVDFRVFGEISEPLKNELKHQVNNLCLQKYADKRG